MNTTRNALIESKARTYVELYLRGIVEGGHEALDAEEMANLYAVARSCARRAVRRGAR